MRITILVSGHFDWVPLPANTEVTQADVAALRVKQDTADAWKMRVERKVATHLDIGIHEATIARIFASYERLGREPTRADIVVQEIKATLPHHASKKHLVGIYVHDDGASELMAHDALVAAEVPAEQIDGAIARYAKKMDMQAYLNAVFQTQDPGAHPACTPGHTDAPAAPATTSSTGGAQ